MKEETDRPTGQIFAEDPCPAPPPPNEKKVLKPHKTEIHWRNVFIYTYVHLSSIIGLYMAVTNTKWQTLLFTTVLYMCGKIGMTAGVHRLWSHRSYKANFPLRVLLMVFFTIGFEGMLYIWARDHRVHHKYQETDADPYNANRGMWFAHVGWLLQKKHPDVIEKGNQIDVSDLKADKVVMFQRKYYWHLVLLLSLILPSVIPVYCWGESWMSAWHVAVCLRLVLTHNGTALINSVAHKYGSQPYDVNFFARENTTVSVVTLGEGWHNYHHTFPWDYKASELGNYALNMSTAFIDFFAKIGWAYDLKTVSAEMVRKRALRTGDGSHKAKELWGWDDKDMTKEERQEATVIRSKGA